MSPDVAIEIHDRAALCVLLERSEPDGDIAGPVENPVVWLVVRQVETDRNRQSTPSVTGSTPVSGKDASRKVGLRLGSRKGGHVANRGFVDDAVAIAIDVAGRLHMCVDASLPHAT